MCRPWAKCLAHDAACLPFGMVGEPRRKLGPITTLVLLLSMGVDLMDIRVSKTIALHAILHASAADSRFDCRPQCAVDQSAVM